MSTWSGGQKAGRPAVPNEATRLGGELKALRVPPFRRYLLDPVTKVTFQIGKHKGTFPNGECGTFQILL